LEKKKKTERYWPKLSEKKDWFMWKIVHI
jgi:hypothetical protein